MGPTNLRIYGIDITQRMDASQIDGGTRCQRPLRPDSSDRGGVVSLHRNLHRNELMHCAMNPTGQQVDVSRYGRMANRSACSSATRMAAASVAPSACTGDWFG